MYSIYKLNSVNPDIADCYIGKTSNCIKRMYQHKTDCKYYQHLRLYQFIKDNGGFDSFTMTILETDITKEQGPLKERQYYDIYKPSLNCNIPNRTQKESRSNYQKSEYNKTYRSKYYKQYNANKKLIQLNNGVQQNI